MSENKFFVHGRKIETFFTVFYKQFINLFALSRSHDLKLYKTSLVMPRHRKNIDTSHKILERSSAKG